MKKLLVFLCCQLLVVTCMLAQDNARLTDTNLGLTVIVESEPSPGWLNFKTSENVNPATIFQVYKSEFGLGIDDEMVLLDSFTDGIGFTNYFYKQTYKGVEIESAIFSIVAQNGIAIKGNGVIHSNHGFINTNPSISYANAVNYAINHLGSSQNWENISPTLQGTKIYQNQNSDFYLGYRIFLGSQDDNYSVFVNSTNGNVEDLLEMGHQCGSGNITANIDFNDHLDKYINLAISEQVNTTEIDDICVYKDTDRSNLTLVYNEEFLDLDNNGTNDFSSQLQYPNLVNGFEANYYTENEDLNDFSQCQNTVNPTECSYFVNGVASYFLGAFSYDSYIQLINNDNITPDFTGGQYTNQDPKILLKDFVKSESIYYPNSNAIFISKSHANTDILFHEFNHLLNVSLDYLEIDFFDGSILERRIAGSLVESFADIYAIIDNRRLGKQFIEDNIDPNTGSVFDYRIPDWEVSGREINRCTNYTEVFDSENKYEIGKVNSHWFYQIINGAIGGSGDCQTIDVEPLSQNEDLAWEIAEKIVWRNFSKKLFGTVSFNDARQGSIEAVKELYPDDYCILKTVIDAWHNVGIGGTFEEYAQAENLNLNPYPATETVHNSNTTPWNDGDFYVDGIIRVTGNWSINNANVYFENRNSGIIIEQGGKLTITNSNLVASGCNSDMWRGIQILGTPSIPHPVNNFDPTLSYPEFGILIMSDSKIEDALIGVRATYIGSYNGNPGPPDGEWGSGIIRLENNDFVNNRQGIRMDWHTQNSNNGNLNKINNCRFVNNKPLPDYDLDYDNQFEDLITFQNDIRQIDLGGAQNVRVTNCNFSAPFLDFSQPSQQVTGIYCSYCSGSIGDESNINQKKNEFSSLYKGISIFGFESGQALNSFGNSFFAVKKGITLNTASFTTIQQNEFKSIPIGTIEDDSYGILVYHSSGCDINNNHFNTVYENTDHLRGIVLVNTNNTLIDIPDPMNITANTFSSYISSSGNFKSAIELEGDNRNCQLQCNIFENDNAADWRFVFNGTQLTLLDEQGTDPTTFIGSEDISESFSTTWYRNASDARTGYDISIDNYGSSTADKLTLHPDTEDSSPDYIYDPNNQYEERGYELNISFDCESLIEGLADDPPPPSTNCITHRYEMKNYARQPTQAEYLIEYLDCHNAVWADQILVGNYMSTQQLAKARTTLETIPLDSEENREFYETYDEALTYLENGQSAGKAAAAIHTLKEVAGPANPQKRAGKKSAMAESFLAAMNGTNFTRSALSGKKNAAQSSIFTESNVSLTLFPNPANELVSIVLNNQMTENGILEIYDLQGKLLKSIHLNAANNAINVQELDTGMYICNYSNDAGKQFSSKLIINR